MSIEIHKEDLEKIIKVLGSLAAGSSEAQNFFHDLIRRADIPEDWEIELLQKKELSASDLIYWARSKGKNPKDDRYHTLGSILNALLDETGDREEIAIFMIRYELCDINLLPEELRSKINIQDIAQQKLKYSIIPKTAKEDLENILREIKFITIKNACRRSLPRLAQHCALTIKDENLDQIFTLLLEECQYRNDGTRRILEFAWRLRENPRLQGQQVHLKLDNWFKRYNFESPNISDTNLGHIPQPRLFIQVTPKHRQSDQRGISDQFSVQAWLIPDQSWLISDVNMLHKTYAENEYFYLDFSYLLSDYGNSDDDNSDDENKVKISDFISQSLWDKIQQLQRENSPQDKLAPREAKYIRDFSFSKEELKELLELFLNESLLILFYEAQEVSKGTDACELTIELFLPSDLLCNCDIDQWSFRDLAEDHLSELRIGSSYQVLIRSLERSKWLQSTDDIPTRSLRVNDKKKKSWQRKWELIQSKLSEGKIPSDLEFKLFSHLKSFDNLGIELDQKIGVKLVQGSQRDEILRVIINEESIPIVLWTRCDDSELDFSNELNELVHKDPLLNLPQSVLKVRKAAQESGSKNHLGCHLVLLWDDPNRCPPPEGGLLQVDSRARSKQ